MESFSTGYFFSYLQLVIKAKLIHDKKTSMRKKKKKPCRSYFAPERLRFLMLEKGEKGKLKLASSGAEVKTPNPFTHLPENKWQKTSAFNVCLRYDKIHDRRSAITLRSQGNIPQEDQGEKHHPCC